MSLIKNNVTSIFGKMQINNDKISNLTQLETIRFRLGLGPSYASINHFQAPKFGRNVPFGFGSVAIKIMISVIRQF